MKKLILMLLLVTIFPTCVFAYTYSVAFDNSTQFNTTGLSGYATTGADMDGMTVTAWYANGDTPSSIWQHTDTTSGGISSMDFNLNESGNTYNNTWTLDLGGRLTPMTSIRIDAGTGNTVFDTIKDVHNSPNSAKGWPFEVISAPSYLDIAAIYSGPVSVSGTSYGDLYRYLTLNFSGLDVTGLEPGGILSFRTDTDSLLYSNDINPVATPEPATFILLGSGLAGLAFYRRKRK